MSTHQSNLTKTIKIYESNPSPHQSQLNRNFKRGDSDIQRLYHEIKKIKYPVLAIEPAEHLLNKISHFKNQKLQNQMKLKLIQQKNLNAYRKIRGDGNCFIRALAYSYLSNIKDLSDVKATFYQLQEVDLTVCLPQSIPKEFKPFYNDRVLKELLLSNWEIDVRHFKNLCRDNNKRILSRLFRKSPYLDFIVILYFRCLCLKGLEKHRDDLRDFMKGTEEEQIKTYGEQSEGIILDICSRFLKVSIDVFEVRKQDINQYGYRNQRILKESFNVSLLYYENHYDIIETIDPRLLDQERNDAKIQQEQYYSKINEKMIEGNCIECNKDDYIYEENYLCDKCFEISKQQMLNTVKQDKWVRGTCRDCGRSGLKVLEMISLCESCAKRQAEVSQQDIMRSSPKKNSFHCSKCSTELNQKDQCPKCSTIEIGMCIQCDEKRYIDKQTKLCRYCRNYQSQAYAKNQKKQEYLKNQCPNCKQQLDSYYHEYKCLKKTVRAVDVCHYCNESKDSDIHEMKCVKKLTAGRIGLSNNQKQKVPSNIPSNDEQKQQNEVRKCRNCNIQNSNQTLVGGYCRKCRDYFSAEQRHKEDKNNVNEKNNGSYFGSGSIIRQSSHRIEERPILIGGQTCKGCKNHFYITKLIDGYCTNCEPHYYRGYRF